MVLILFLLPGLLLPGPAVTAQLRSEPPRPTTPPELGEENWTTRVLERLDGEINTLIAVEKAGSAIEQQVSRARINVRIIAVDVISAGDTAGPDGSIATVAGLTLFNNRSSIDDALQRVAEFQPQEQDGPARETDDDSNNGNENGTGDDGDDNLTVEQYEAALRMIKLFNEKAVELAASVRTADPAELDEALATVLSPLARALHTIEQAELRSHWLQQLDLDQSATEDDETALIAALDKSLARFNGLDIDESTAEEFNAIVEMLRRGAAFDDLRPQVQQYVRLLEVVVSAAEAMEGAPGVPDQLQEQFRRCIGDGLVAFADPERREGGRQQLQSAAAGGETIGQLSHLLRLPQKRGREMRELLQFVHDGLKGACEQPEQTGRFIRQLEQLSAILERMIDFRMLPSDRKLAPPLRQVERQLKVEYIAAERALLQRIDAIVSDPYVMADPALSSLIVDQAQYLRDLHRLSELEAWVQTISQRDPDRTTEFQQRITRLMEELTDVNRRPDAIRTLDRFEKERQQLLSFNFEQQLRRDTEAATIATGGLQRQIVARIDELREQWAAEWASGRTESDTVEQLQLLQRLLQMIADTHHVQAARDQPLLLNRWSAWEMNSQTLARAMSDLPNRIKLASAAVVRQRYQEAREQLDRAEADAPLGMFVGRLLADCSGALGQLPAGGTGAVNQLFYPPGDEDDVLMIDQRMQLALLCRYAAEHEAARTAGRIELANDLRDYVNGLSLQLLDAYQRRRP